MPTREDLGRIYRISDAFNRDLLAQEKQAVSRLHAAYQSAWRRLDEDIRRVSREIAARRKNGQDAGYRLTVQRRLETLKAQIEQELAPLAYHAADATETLQRAFTEHAQDHAEHLVRAQGDVPAAVDLARLSTDAFEHLVGHLGDGSPLLEVLEKHAGKRADAMAQTLTDAFAQGRGSIATAREVRQEFGLSMLDAVRITRTESMRAYTQSSHEYYRENSDVVEGWLWNCALDSRSCAACLSMHGSFHPLDEELDDHVMGRCVPIPVTQSFRSLADQGTAGLDAQDWLDGQDFETRVEVFGSQAAVHAYERGEVTLQDFAGRRYSEDYGSSVERRSLRGAQDAAHARIGKDKAA